MASTVNEAFYEFNKNTVNLLKERTDKARSSREWLINQLNQLEDKEDLNFPLKYKDKHINFGSFQRRTKIRELDDVDLMFCFTANGATYTEHSTDSYVINTPDAGKRLKYLSDDDVLNSKRVVNKIKKSLSSISQYSSADLHSRGEAATLKLLSYEWVFDIVPCFYTDTNLYLIPNGKGNWKATDPRVDQKFVSEENQTKEGKLLQLIRCLKYWNRINSSYTIGSYVFEILVINYSKTKTNLNVWIDYDISDFMNFLSSAIRESIYDPKGIQGDLNTFNYYEKFAISEIATRAYHKAIEAIKAETEDNDIKKSIGLWREIFGRSFPKYQ